MRSRRFAGSRGEQRALMAYMFVFFFLKIRLVVPVMFLGAGWTAFAMAAGLAAWDMRQLIRCMIKGEAA
jgi:hypothetical protein